MSNQLVEKAKYYFIKNKEIITYVFFGGLTTLFYMALYFLFTKIFFWSTAVSATLAFIAATIFAFVTNKIWVFESKSWKFNILSREFISFFSARGIALLLNTGITTVGVDYLGIWELAVVGFSQVFVIVFNYFASKLFVFKKKRGV